MQCTSRCTSDSDFVEDNFDNIDTGAVPLVKRLWTTLRVFRFYNSQDVYIECSVKLCPSSSSSCDLVGNRYFRTTWSFRAVVIMYLHFWPYRIQVTTIPYPVHSVPIFFHFLLRSFRYQRSVNIKCIYI